MKKSLSLLFLCILLFSSECFARGGNGWHWYRALRNFQLGSVLLQKEDEISSRGRARVKFFVHRGDRIVSRGITTNSEIASKEENGCLKRITN